MLSHLGFLALLASGFVDAVSSSTPTGKSTVTVTSKAPPTTTTAAATKTYCPQYYVTPVSPTPSSVCSAQGTLAKPAQISRVCYDDFGQKSSDGSIDCYRSCSNDSRCVSYSYDSSNGYCTLYSQSLAQMGFKAGKSNPSTVGFWNLRDCYVCKQDPPAPAQPQCRATPALKPASERKDYICGVPGTFDGDGTVQVEQFIYQGQDIDTCYRECVKRNVEGVCEGFTFYPYSDRASQLYVACGLLATDAAKLNFRSASMSETYYNLRGCYKCDGPKTATSTCKVTSATAAAVTPN